jgi:hypothetical protein
MTTSRKTNDLNHPVLRVLVDTANAMPLEDRVTLLKALLPGVAKQMPSRDFEGLLYELRLKGERYYDAVHHPGEGRKSRHVMGERDIEGR